MRRFVMMGLLALAGCNAAYKDTEQETYNAEAFLAVLNDQGEEFRPRKMVYVPNPEKAPSRAWIHAVRYTSFKIEFDKIFGLYLLKEGFTVGCAYDERKDNIFMVLIQDGVYLASRVVENDSSDAITCKREGAL